MAVGCVAAIINVAAQLGDLLESAIKRGVGVKDSEDAAGPRRHPGPHRRAAGGAPALWWVLLLKDAFSLGRSGSVFACPKETDHVICVYLRK